MSERDLHGGFRRVRVSEDGKLVYSFFASAHFLGKVGFESGVVPEDIVANGAQAVRQYVDDIIVDMQRREAEIHAAYRHTRDSTRVRISVDREGEKLRGVMTTSAHKGGLACFDVRLTSPSRYSGIETIYEHKYPCPRKGLLDERGNHTEIAVQEARETLVKIYKKRRHELEYANVYAVAREVQAQLKG